MKAIGNFFIGILLILFLILVFNFKIVSLIGLFFIIMTLGFIVSTVMAILNKDAESAIKTGLVSFVLIILIFLAH